MWSISNFRIAILLLSCHEITENFFAVEGAGNPAGNQVGGVLELILCDVGILSR